MAAARWRPNARLSELLFTEPWRFDFFQAVRLLERAEGQRHAAAGHSGPHPVGYAKRPNEEAVRFRALPSRSFPAGELAELRRARPAGENGDKYAPPEMRTTFLGLTGPAGVLPEHYTDLVLRRTRDRDFALRDFLDLFNHRSVSLFYRAWEKYRFPFGYERAQRDGTRDLFTQCLQCLVGLGTEQLSGRLAVDDETFLYYAGHFAHQPRSAAALEEVLCDYFDVPVTVEQFHGRWLHLAAEDRTVLPSSTHRRGRNAQLGVDAVLGERVWDVQSALRLRLGPMSYRTFTDFLPSGGALSELWSLSRLYAGPQFTLGVQLVVAADEAPPCRLGYEVGYEPRLGWNTWLCGKPHTRDAADAAFWLQDIDVRASFN